MTLNRLNPNCRFIRRNGAVPIKTSGLLWLYCFSSHSDRPFLHLNAVFLNDCFSTAMRKCTRSFAQCGPFTVQIWPVGLRPRPETPKAIPSQPFPNFVQTRVSTQDSQFETSFTPVSPVSYRGSDLNKESMIQKGLKTIKSMIKSRTLKFNSRASC